MIDSTIDVAGVDASPQNAVSRRIRFTSAIVVTDSMMIACALIVRRAWLPGSDERCQSAQPVSAASSDTTTPPRISQVLTRNSACAPLLAPMASEMMSKTAAKIYAPTGMSVSGGWNGFPANPRRP